MSEHASRGPKNEASVDDFSRLSSNDWYQTPPEDDESKALRIAAKEAFLVNQDVRYPDITYPRLDELDVDTVERHYQHLLLDAQAVADESEPDQRYESAARKLAEMYRHKEVQRRLGWSQNPELSRERAGAATFELFGEIDKEDFAQLLADLRADASKVADHSQEARELLALTGEMPTQLPQVNYEITRQTVELLRADIYELFPGLEEVLESVPTNDAPVEQKAAFMQRVIDCVSSDPTAKLNLISNSKLSASTSTDDRQVSIGADRLATYSSTQLIKTAVHEAIGHLERGNRAAAQPREALRHTHANNLAFEEGFATAIEQIITGETRTAGEQYYLAIGLQLGLDRGGKKRDFRETHEIMWRRLVVEALVNGDAISPEQARVKAYDQVMRTNRGGAIDARDISYFEGSKRYTWVNTIASLEPSERKRALRIALSGRFDAADPEQWKKFEAADKDKETV